MGGKLYVASVPSAAQPFGLFISDGTVAGTKNLGVSVDDGFGQGVLSPLHVHAGKVYFMSTRFPLIGPSLPTPALWVTDGTVAGTMVVKAGFRFGRTEFASVGATLYFSATTAASGNELWKTDGTDIGTAIVSDIHPDAASSSPSGLRVLGTKLVFAASNGPTRELYATDGTAPGTTAISAIFPAGSADPKSLTVLGTKGYFTAEDATRGRELWQTDGTPAGTVLTKEIFPGTTGSDISEIVALGGKLLFPANNDVNGTELFVSDGTPAGTALLHDIETYSSSNAFLFTGVNGRVVFRARSGPTPASPNDEMWVTDGTTDGTTMKDINPGDGSSDAQFYSSYVFGKTLYFSANDGTHGQELWASDGTIPGTRLVRDLDPGSGGASPWQFMSFAGSIFFVTQGSLHSLWKTDGTAEGTVDLAPGKFNAATFGRGPVEVGGALLFVAKSAANGSELWKSDGTPTGTVLLKDINPGPGDGAEYSQVVFNGSLYLTATTAGEGKELWKSDGTPEGTVLVKDINPLAASSDPREFFEYDGALYFTAVDASGRELWKTDGTTTTLVKDIHGGAGSSNPTGFFVSGGQLFFVADDGSSGRELWVSDGTAAGTKLVKDILPGAGNALRSSPDFYEVKGALVFEADDGVHGKELWKSDGTAAGTVLVKDIWPGPWSGLSSLGGQPVKGGPVLLAASDGVGGVEIWRTDGTPEGTGLFYEMTPGPSSSHLGGLFEKFGDRVYFTADDSKTGFEPWTFPASALK